MSRGPASRRGAGAAWTDERGTSEEGRGRLKRAPEAGGDNKRMPADCEGIREENIARYGWDTAVLDLLGQLYSERTHFIFELIQNAEDAGATELTFELFEDRLELRHDGRPFTEADVR